MTHLTKFIFILSLPFILLAEGNVFSNIPPAKIEIINVNPESCDEDCLFDLSKNKKIFSFIARFDRNIQDEKLQNLMMEYSSEVGIYYKVRFDLLGEKLEVALLIPRKLIGKYSTTTTDTILAYLLSRDLDFKFKVFDSVDENPNSISNALNEMRKEHFNFMIAIISKKETLDIIENINMPVYIPTMSNINMSSRSDSNIIFGGIDYFAQIKSLLNEVDSNIIISYNDDSQLGLLLGNMLSQINDGNKKLINEVVNNKAATNFSSSLEKQKNNIEQSSVFLNTRVIISGLLLSQINMLDKLPQKIFSTQVNYNPALLSLLRGVNTDNIFIINSIGEINQKLLEYGYLLSSDMKYDWVNYSTALGVDLFLHNMAPNIDRYFNEEVNDNIVIYNNSLYGVENGLFVKL